MSRCGDLLFGAPTSQHGGERRTVPVADFRGGGRVPVIRSMRLHAWPADPFDRLTGELVLDDMDDDAPRRHPLRGSIGRGFAARDLPGRRRGWKRCGAALDREIATRICRLWLRVREQRERPDRNFQKEDR